MKKKDYTLTIISETSLKLVHIEIIQIEIYMIISQNKFALNKIKANTFLSTRKTY
jgi:hypothetical protein